MLLAQLLESAKLDPLTGCRVRGRADRYARITRGGRTLLAHRVTHGLALAARLGLPKPLPIPPRIVIRHGLACTSKACIWPEHLSAGTQAENLRDMVLAGRSTRGTKNARAKINENDVRRIRAAPRTGAARAALSGELGIHADHVRHVQAGRFWSWLP